jgi:spore maturation protein CgeB
MPIAAAKYLYQECGETHIVEMPHALNPKTYFPIPGMRREVDIGFIGDIYWPFIGDRERTDLIEWFERHGAHHCLRCDIRKQRVSRDAWNMFLNGCNAIIGAESGSYYLNERGGLLERARTYNLFENCAASFDEVFDRFYRDQPREVSCKSISSRHFEPIGTKTCQILLEGHYNGILEPDRHYISLRKDLADIDQAIEKYRDENYRRRMVEDTHDYVLSQHTYAHRVANLLRIVTESAQA